MIKAKFVNLAGRKFTKVFKGRDFCCAQTAMQQYIEDKKDVILIGYEEA